MNKRTRKASVLLLTAGLTLTLPLTASAAPHTTLGAAVAGAPIGGPFGVLFMQNVFHENPAGYDLPLGNFNEVELYLGTLEPGVELRTPAGDSYTGDTLSYSSVEYRQEGNKLFAVMHGYKNTGGQEAKFEFTPQLHQGKSDVTGSIEASYTSAPWYATNKDQDVLKLPTISSKVQNLVVTLHNVFRFPNLIKGFTDESGRLRTTPIEVRGGQWYYWRDGKFSL